MEITSIPFQIVNWTTAEQSEQAGETGTAQWQTQYSGSIRIRKVNFTAGYRADTWCSKGHVVLCLEGHLHTEFADGRSFELSAGECFVVADNYSPHKSSTAVGAKLFIVD
jgi:quercetin dioxygenase-like cupin family protein